MPRERHGGIINSLLPWNSRAIAVFLARAMHVYLMITQMIE